MTYTSYLPLSLSFNMPHGRMKWHERYAVWAESKAFFEVVNLHIYNKIWIFWTGESHAQMVHSK